MSGNLIKRINRTWLNTSYPGGSHFAFFHEWISFVESHPNFEVIAYGNAGSQIGPSLPEQWINWDQASDPSVLIPQITNNSWFVVRANKASPTLNGGGTYKWEAKIQVTGVATFTDPSGDDYGLTTETNIVAMRASAHGGWDEATLDFAPSSGADSSDNYVIYNADVRNYWVDILADDDCMWWRGTCDTGASALMSQSRGGHIGMINRRSPDVDDPFVFFAGRIWDNGASTGQYAIIRRSGNNTDQYRYDSDFTSDTMPWPSYSISADGTSKVETHKMDMGHLDIHTYGKVYKYNSDEPFYSRILIAQWDNGGDYNIMGELLPLIATSNTVTENNTVGDLDEWLQIAYQTSTYHGIAMMWDPGVSSIW